LLKTRTDSLRRLGRELEPIVYVARELEQKFPETELIIGSIRSPEDIYRIASAKPQIITIPTKIVNGLIDGRMTIEMLKEHKRTFEPHEIIIGDSITHQ